MKHAGVFGNLLTWPAVTENYSKSYEDIFIVYCKCTVTVSFKVHKPHDIKNSK